MLFYPFSQTILSHPFTLTCQVCFFWWQHQQQYRDVSCFLIQSVNLCHFIGELRTLKVIVEQYTLISDISLLCEVLLGFFSFHFFSFNILKVFRSVSYAWRSLTFSSDLNIPGSIFWRATLWIINAFIYFYPRMFCLSYYN